MKKKNDVKKVGVGKSAAKKPASAKSADPGTATGTVPTHGWADVVSRVQAPSDNEQALYAVQVTPDLLRAEGVQIASSRILTDALRWSGTLIDFVASAPPELQREVRGFSPGLLRVFVAEGYRLYEMNQRFEADHRARKVGAKVDQAAATSSRKLAQSYRRQLFTAIKVAAQANGTVLRRLAEAQACTDLATSMHALVTLARELLDGKPSPISQRLTLGGLDAPYLTTLEQLATQSEAASTRITGPKKATTVSQGELDVQDGVCLAIMDQLLILFDAAHAINPKIPALIPIATRRYFVGHKASAKTPPAPPTPGDGKR